MGAIKQLSFSMGGYTHIGRPHATKFSMLGLLRSILLLCTTVGIAQSASAVPNNTLYLFLWAAT